MKVYKVMDDCCGEVATVKWERYSRRTRRRWVVSWASGRAAEGFDRFEDVKRFVRRLRHSHNLRFIVAPEITNNEHSQEES